jgi:hypothetical protein
MKPYALAALAGAACLLATYSLTREGSIPLALIVIAFIGGACGLVAVAMNGESGNLRIGLLTLSFAIGGAMLSEVVAFTRYFFAYGYQDPKLSVGVAVSVLEFGAIALVGGIATLSAAFMAKRRITRRSSGTAQKRAAP